MEREIQVAPGDNLESVVYTLLAEKAKGKHAFCFFNNHKLHSDTVTMDSAFKEVTGFTKEEFDKKQQEWREEFEREQKEREAREQEYAQIVEAGRTDESRKITLDKVIAGLKFIAYNQNMDQKELIEGLLRLGCGFSLEDIVEQFPEQVKLFEGVKNGDISCGASIIANVRDSEFGRAYCDDRFLSVDDDTSIYHFIRITTGDQTFTKEKIDGMNESSEAKL